MRCGRSTKEINLEKFFAPKVMESKMFEMDRPVNVGSYESGC